MTDRAEDMIVRNLIKALDRLRDDLDRVELWTAALSDFQKPVPDHQPRNEYLRRSASRLRRGL